MFFCSICNKSAIWLFMLAFSSRRAALSHISKHLSTETCTTCGVEVTSEGIIQRLEAHAAQDVREANQAFVWHRDRWWPVLELRLGWWMAVYFCFILCHLWVDTLLFQEVFNSKNYFYFSGRPPVFPSRKRFYYRSPGCFVLIQP